MKSSSVFSVKANGNLIDNGIKLTQVPGAILSVFVNDLPYLSVDNIREKISEIEDMCRESEIKHAKFFKYMWRTIGKNNHKKIVEALYNAILGSEGLSTLPGFGYAIKSGESFNQLSGNAEKVSIMKAGS